MGNYSLGLPPGLDAPVMTFNSVTFLFCPYASTELHLLAISIQLAHLVTHWDMLYSIESSVVSAGVWQDDGVQGYGGGSEGSTQGQPGWHHYGGYPSQQEGGAQGGLL